MPAEWEIRGEERQAPASAAPEHAGSSPASVTATTGPAPAVLASDGVSLAQRQALARAFAAGRPNGSISRSARVLQRSPISDEVSTLWNPASKGAFFERLRHLDQSDQDLVTWVDSALVGDDLWLARNLIQYGPEPNWPIHLRVEREMKGWGDSGGKGAVFDILRAANGAEAGNAQLTASLARVFGPGTDDLWLAQQLQRFGPEAGFPAAEQQELRKRRVVWEMQSMVGQGATWVPSGGAATRGSGDVANTFAAWAEAASEGAAPPLTAATTINCWEMVLLAAYRTGLLTWQWIHDTYVEAGQADWFDYLVHRLTPGSRTAYDRAAHSPNPGRGDIVFWNGADHVGLALGTRDGLGRAQVLSFWPPPGLPSRRHTYDVVKVTTIEELADYMLATWGPPCNVEFGAPPW